MNRELDLLGEPLAGVRLVEAGAGSGKTFAVAALYLRLVLEQGLRPEQIVVVTFTEAAAGELRDRIRARLRSARQALNGNVHSSDPFLRGLIGQYTEPARREHVQTLLRDALREFDNAAIHTIHAFCRRQLQEYAFESGAAFNAEFLHDQSGLVEEVAGDFWRKRIYPLGPLRLAGLKASKLSHEGLCKLARIRLNHANAELAPVATVDEGELTRAEQGFAAAFQSVRDKWREPGVAEEVKGLLGQEGMYKAYYSEAKLPALWRNLESLLAGSPARAMTPFKEFGCLAAGFVADKAGKKVEVPPEHPFFDLCEVLLQLRDELAGQYAAVADNVRREFAEQLPGELAGRKQALGVLGFDDLIADMDKALRGEGAGGMRRAVRARYKAALIDEFQDTDPVQYSIFQRALRDRPLFFIGDPKQAIY
ncbi:MAG: exodeoxyribonuclease V subunit beta, partial [Desulfovibrio sp.]